VTSVLAYLTSGLDRLTFTGIDRWCRPAEWTYVLTWTFSGPHFETAPVGQLDAFFTFLRRIAARHSHHTSHTVRSGRGEKAACVRACQEVKPRGRRARRGHQAGRRGCYRAGAATHKARHLARIFNPAIIVGQIERKGPGALHGTGQIFTYRA
jgi:hypothetical protein